MDDFREQSLEPVQASLRVAVQVRESSVWVGVYRLDGSPHAGGSHLWSRRYERPPGKDLGQCVEACLTAALRAQGNGLVVT